MSKKNKTIKLIASLTMLPILSSCAINPQTKQVELSPAVSAQLKNTFNNSDPCSNNDRNIGIAVGGIVGGVVGYLRDGGKGAIAGAVIGSGGGFLVGHLMDGRRCKLYKIAQENHLQLMSATITDAKLNVSAPQSTPMQNQPTIGVDVQLQNEPDEFKPGTAILTSRAHDYLSQIAQEYTPTAMGLATQNGTAKPLPHPVLIVGHTNEQDTGSSLDLAKMSQERARAVAEVFAQNGVPAKSIYYQGAGDALPVATNATTKGREENQRVQIVDVPTETDLKKYLSLRVPNPQNFTANATATIRPPVLKKGNNDSGQAYDFGGQLDSKKEMLSLGLPINTSMFSIIQAANAASIVMGSCRDDHPHNVTTVRNLATGAPLPPVRDAVPGIYGEPITGMLNGNYVAILNAYAPKDAGEPVPAPEVEIYKNYTKKHESHPSYKKSVSVVVYRGTDATLYRMFVNGPMECMDLVVPTRVGSDNGRVYYLKSKKSFVAQAGFVAHN